MRQSDNEDEMKKEGERKADEEDGEMRDDNE